MVQNLRYELRMGYVATARSFFCLGLPPAPVKALFGSCWSTLRSRFKSQCWTLLLSRKLMNAFPPNEAFAPTNERNVWIRRCRVSRCSVVAFMRIHLFQRYILVFFPLPLSEIKLQNQDFRLEGHMSSFDPFVDESKALVRRLCQKVKAKSFLCRWVSRLFLRDRSSGLYIS